MGQSKGPQPRHQHHRLGIAHPAAARGGVAVVADGQVSGHAGQHVLIKHLANQAHVLVKTHLAFVEHRDASRFLASMLQGIQTEISQVRHRLFPGQNGEDTAGLFHPIGTLCLQHVH